MEGVPAVTNARRTLYALLAYCAHCVGNSDMSLRPEPNVLSRWNHRDRIHKGAISTRVYKEVKWNVQDNILGASDGSRHHSSHKSKCLCVVAHVCCHNCRPTLSVQKANCLIKCSIGLPHVCERFKNCVIFVTHTCIFAPTRKSLTVGINERTSSSPSEASGGNSYES